MSRQFRFLILVLILPVVCIAQDWTGKVVSVSDGDTIGVLHNGKAEKIRLAEIDCPEDGQAFGQRAKQFTSGLVFGKVVTVHPTGRDRYSRTVAHVFIGNQNLSREIVRSGYAWWFKKYSKDESLGELEHEARNQKRGLWADPHAVPPWAYRKRE